MTCYVTPDSDGDRFHNHAPTITSAALAVTDAIHDAQHALRPETVTVARLRAAAARRPDRVLTALRAAVLVLAGIAVALAALLGVRMAAPAALSLPAAQPAAAAAPAAPAPAPAPAAAPAPAPAAVAHPARFGPDLDQAGVAAPRPWEYATGTQICGEWAHGFTRAQTDPTLIAAGVQPGHVAPFDSAAAADLCPAAHS